MSKTSEKAASIAVPRIALTGLAFVLLAATLAAPPARAGAFGDRLRERLEQRRQQREQGEEAQGVARSGQAALPPGVSVRRNVGYGSAPQQRFDIYLPPHPDHAPVIFMVHGGGWRRGDKTMKSVVENKVAHWVPKGIILVSTDYRLLPDADPLQQADDVGAALAEAQRQAASWGGDPARFVLMGHSAGAHLVSLIESEPSIATRHGARPWLGTVSLDSAGLDVVKVMEGQHMKLYDDAFGTDPAFWASASPYRQLQAGGAPFLAVCSSRRKDSCPQAHSFVSKAATLGIRASVLEEYLTHRHINEDLGLDGDYTAAVDRFLAGLDPRFSASVQ